MKFAVVLLLALATWLPRAEAQRAHVVRSGDTIAKIARRYRVSPSNLMAANRMKKSARIRPGQVLDVPAAGVVYVRPGQTLSRIAKKNRCSVVALAKANRLRPSSHLKVGQRLYLPGFSGGRSARKQDWGPPSEPGIVDIRRRDRRAKIRLMDNQGRVSEKGLRQLGDLMQRLAEDKGRTAHPKLAWLVAKISDHFGGRPISLVSGFRDARGFTRETSQHISGRAMDVRVQGVPNRALWDYCRSLAGAGCGYYPRSTFVHVDARERRTQWVDWSRPGKRPRYGNLRGPRRRRRGRRGRGGIPWPKIAERIPEHVELVRDDVPDNLLANNQAPAGSQRTKTEVAAETVPPESNTSSEAATDASPNDGAPMPSPSLGEDSDPKHTDSQNVDSKKQRRTEQVHESSDSR